MYSNKIVNFQESTTILNACTKKSVNLSYAPRIHLELLQQTRFFSFGKATGLGERKPRIQTSLRIDLVLHSACIEGVR